MADKCILDFVLKSFGAQAKISYEFPVLYHQWECDGFGFVIEHDGDKSLVLSNHGSPFVADASHLEDRLAYYRNVTAATITAIDVMKLSGK